MNSAQNGRIEILAKILYARDGEHLIRASWESENDTFKDVYRSTAAEILRRLEAVSADA